MLIPYGSDAPLYYLPIATGAMILMNILVFFGVRGLEQHFPDNFVQVFLLLCLQFGQGLRPWQWITANFMHADLLHLLGNMFGLWGFGLVVEGKIGWWRFLLVYLGLGVTQCALEQTLMLFASPGAALGASGIVFGLLAMCVVWAPQNEMNCILFLGFRVLMIEVSLYTLGSVAVLIQLGTQLFAGLSLTSEVLHLTGAALGFGVAVVMLKRGWVDCEGWDLFNVWAGTETKDRDEENDAARDLVREAEERRLKALGGGKREEELVIAPRPAAPPPAAGAAAPAPHLWPLQQALAAADPQRAFTIYQQVAAANPAAGLPEAELLQIISLFHRQQLWAQSVPAMVAYLKSFRSQETLVRLWLARILLQAQNRPDQALAVLSKLTESSLTNDERALFHQVREAAEQMRGR